MSPTLHQASFPTHPLSCRTVYVCELLRQKFIFDAYIRHEQITQSEVSEKQRIEILHDFLNNVFCLGGRGGGGGQANYFHSVNSLN